MQDFGTQVYHSVDYQRACKSNQTTPGRFVTPELAEHMAGWSLRCTAWQCPVSQKSMSSLLKMISTKNLLFLSGLPAHWTNPEKCLANIGLDEYFPWLLETKAPRIWLQFAFFFVELGFLISLSNYKSLLFLRFRLVVVTKLSASLLAYWDWIWEWFRGFLSLPLTA